MPPPRRRRRTKSDNSLQFPQLQQQRLRNRFSPLEPLDEEQLETLHEASLNLLEDQGVEVSGELAQQLFRQAGAEVNQQGLVRIDRNLVLETIAKAPESFTLTPRNPQNTFYAGGDTINFGLVSGPPNVHDCIQGRRAGNLHDYKKLISLGQFFNVLTFFGNQAIAPTELPPGSRHLDTTLVNLTLADKVFFTSGIGAGRVRDAAEMCAIARGISLQEMANSPTLLTNININSPRKLDDSMAYGAMQMALLGQAVAVTPFTLMGAMTPATMAAALTQQNAEALLGITLVQLTRPGAPVIYGGFTSNVDMRSGAPVFGTPENSLANLAGGQFARKYRLPYRSSACNASNTVDGQAAYETQMALWGAVMGRANFVYHAAGWLESGLVASFEKLMMDCEMLQQMSAMLQPVTVNPAEIGMDTIAEVGPGGHFFGCEHTIARYKDAFYQPFLSDWKNFENWQQAGSKDTTTRATELWQKILREFEPPAIDTAITEALQAYVAIRKEKLGNAEPPLQPEGFF